MEIFWRRNKVNMIIVYLLCIAYLLINKTSAQCTVNNVSNIVCDCHCSSCVNATCIAGCDKGWGGSEQFLCQKRNIAFRKTRTYQSTYRGGNYTADNAVDGNLYTTSATAVKLDQYWTVRLDNIYDIKGMKIFPGGDGKYEVSITNDKDSSDEITFISSQNVKTDVEWDVACTVSGNNIRIMQHGNGSVHLREVEIYACSDGTYGQDCVACKFGYDTEKNVCYEQPTCSDGTYGQDCVACKFGYDTEKDVCYEQPTCSDGTYGQDCVACKFGYDTEKNVCYEQPTCSDGTYGQDCVACKFGYDTEKNVCYEQPNGTYGQDCVACKFGYDTEKDVCYEQPTCSDGTYGQDCVACKFGYDTEKNVCYEQPTCSDGTYGQDCVACKFGYDTEKNVCYEQPRSSSWDSKFRGLMIRLCVIAAQTAIVYFI